MVELSVSAVIIVEADAADVYATLSDYDVGRREIVTDEFSDYEVLRGGQGVGTEVHWNLAVDDVLRMRKGRLFGIFKRSTKRRSPKGSKKPSWDCLVHVDESSIEKIVERDVNSSLVTTWDLRAVRGPRTVVRAEATWEHTGGYLARIGERVAIRMLYEALLARLHEKFELAATEVDDVATAVETDNEKDDEAPAVEES